MLQIISAAERVRNIQSSLIPNSVFTSVLAIADQQALIGRQWAGLASKIHNSLQHGKINESIVRFEVLASRIVAQSIIENDWQTLEEFQGVTTELSRVNEKVVEQHYATKQDIDDIKAWVLARLSQLPKAKRGILIMILLWIDSFFQTVWTYGEIYFAVRDEMEVPGPEPVTKQDFDLFKEELFEVLTQESRYSLLTNRLCKVRLKPQHKSFLVTILPRNTSVLVIAKKGKWAFISYESQPDDIPKTGWVLKKYLSL